MKYILSLIVAVTALALALFSIYANKENKALALENSVALSEIQATLNSLKKNKALALENSAALSKVQAALDTLVLDANIKSLNADQIIAKSMQIIDSDGNERVSISVKDGQSTILLNDENGQMSVELAASSTNNYIELSHMNGQKPRITIGDPEQEYAPLFFTGIINENLTWSAGAEGDRPFIGLAEKLNNFAFQATAIDDEDGQSFLFQVGPTGNYASPFVAIVNGDNTTEAGIYNSGYDAIVSFDYDKNERSTLISVNDIENSFSTALGYAGDQSGIWGMHLQPEDESNHFFLGYEDTEYLSPPVLQVFERDELTTDLNFTSGE